jgi:hypothetical protein
MSRKTYLDGLRVMMEALEYLQADKAGFRRAHEPERAGANPAKLTQLWDWLVEFGVTREVFAPFVETVSRDYRARATCPSTFEQPFYRKLHAVIPEQIRLETEGR